MSEEDIKTEIYTWKTKIKGKEDEKKTIHQPDSILYTTEL